MFTTERETRETDPSGLTESDVVLFDNLQRQTAVEMTTAIRLPSTSFDDALTETCLTLPAVHCEYRTLDLTPPDETAVSQLEVVRDPNAPVPPQVIDVTPRVPPTPVTPGPQAPLLCDIPPPPYEELSLPLPQEDPEVGETSECGRVKLVCCSDKTTSCFICASVTFFVLGISVLVASTIFGDTIAAKTVWLLGPLLVSFAIIVITKTVARIRAITHRGRPGTQWTQTAQTMRNAELSCVMCRRLDGTLRGRRRSGMERSISVVDLWSIVLAFGRNNASEEDGFRSLTAANGQCLMCDNHFSTSQLSLPDYDTAVQQGAPPWSAERPPPEHGAPPPYDQVTRETAAEGPGTDLAPVHSAPGQTETT